MATRAKDGSVGKAKRGTSPSNTTTHTKRITNSSTPAASIAPKPTSPQREKPVPHYLRPTISSRLDSSNSLKKVHGHDDTTNKAALLRRRSFDKPPSSSPSASRVHKALVSPGPRERTLITPSSSFSNKPITPPKPTSERTSKTPTYGKSHSIYTKSSVRKSATPTSKKETNVSASNKASSSTTDTTPTPNVESKQEDNEPLVQEGEEIEMADSEVEHASEVPNSENMEHVDVVETEAKNGEDEENKYSSDISTISEEQNAPQAAQNEETEDQVYEEKANDEHEEENHSKEESNPEESVENGAKVKAEDIGEENANDDPDFANGKKISTEDSGDENKFEGQTLEENKQVHEESQKDKEVENVKGGPEEAKPEAANVVPVPKRQGGQGSKKDSQAYNDVIEETASKLLEKRKNKVKALVGAFETVISLQEPEA